MDTVLFLGACIMALVFATASAYTPNVPSFLICILLSLGFSYMGYQTLAEKLL